MPRTPMPVIADELDDEQEREPLRISLWSSPRRSVCTQPSRLLRAGSGLARMCLYLALAVATFLVHGYHPLAEDGGLYVAGVEYLLDPGLFPRYTGFVTAHLRFSVFAPSLRVFVHLTHLSLESALLGLYLLAALLMFAAADRLLRQIVLPRARWGGLLLLFAWWTLPAAGTALLLEDPYLTARNFVTPLSLLAISLVLSRTQPRRSARLLTYARSWTAVLLFGLLSIAACLHPLMCGYGVALMLCLLAVQSSRRWLWSGLFVVAALGLAAVVQARSAAEPSSVLAADISRYYWFPSLWQWYELLGLAGPLLVLYALQRWCGEHLSEGGRNLCRACLLLGAASVAVTTVFVHTGGQVQAVARMQPLRSFLLIYAVMILLLGSAAASWWQKITTARHFALPAVLLPPSLLLSSLAGIMFCAQRLQFPHSAHLELPRQSGRSPNPWVQAFVWVRLNTPKQDLFALDPHYTEADDAQVFRAIAQRSVLPDYAKDGGEAAITPWLAPAWLAAVQAQSGLNTLPDAERDASLRPLGVNWLVLSTSAKTSHPCPFQNATVKVCRF